VLILRWYWWRVNAWSEIAAMVAPALGFLYLKAFTSIAFPYTLLYLVGWTTICWVIVTLATAPEPESHLIAFYRRVRPGGPGWASIARAAGGPPPERIGGLAIDWVAGWVLIYAVLFGIGSTVLDSWFAAIGCFTVAAIATLVISRDLSRRGWKSLAE
jgi:solute:Na+ symporter, SSS family